MKLKATVVLIIIVGIFLRFYQLGDLPNSYSPDELAQGYTAYSILKTGHDEWGSNNLIYLKSFGDYKLPLQTWLMIPSVKFFGLTPFAVRFPNAIFSIFALISFYFLVKKLFPNNKHLPTIALCLLTLSPWAVPMSRIALEANLVVSLIIIGLTAFLYQRYVFSVFLFALCFYTYHSSKVFLPPFILLLIILSLKDKLMSLKSAAVYLGVFIILLSPLVIFKGQGISRTSDIAIFNPTDKWASVSDSRYTYVQNGLPDVITRLFQNKVTYTFRQFSQNYLTYLSPQFLTTSGAGETTYGMIPGFGVIGFMGSLGLLVFLIKLISTKHFLSRSTGIIIFGVLLTPLAAALAKGSYSGNRVSLMIPFVVIAAAYGLSQFGKITTSIITGLIVIESVFFFTTYFYSADQTLSEGMLYGHQQINQYITALNPSKIIYSRKLSEPQSYYLFFQKIDPQLTQQLAKNWQQMDQNHLAFLDQLGEYTLGKTTFKEISIASDSLSPHTLIIGRPDEFNGVTPTYIISYPYYHQSKPSVYLYLTP